MPRPPSATPKRAHQAWPTPLEAIGLRHRLIGAVAPELTLQSTGRQELNLTDGRASLVAYLFPGSATSPAHGDDTPLADAEEHRAFRDLHKRITRLECMVVGISSQPVAKLQEASEANRLCQPLASDQAFQLQDLLKLPTFRVGAEHIYERLTILITAGKITQVFYPVPAPGRHPEEVLEHIAARA
jgi:peroxiredoxin